MHFILLSNIEMQKVMQVQIYLLFIRIFRLFTSLLEVVNILKNYLK